MASFVEQVRIMIDVATDKAAAGFKDLQTSVGNADGMLGKLKAGAGSLGSTLQAMPLPVTAAGFGAVAASAVSVGEKLIGLGNDFAHTALASRDLSEATGLGVEKASEWIAAADDVGVSAETVTSTFGKFAKAVGSTPEKFAELGVSIVHAKDGTVDMTGTLLHAIDTINGIEDPTKKAALASQLFGKSWQTLIPLLDRGSQAISDAMNATSDAQRITEDEVASAKEWQAAMDDLSDVAVNLRNELGKLVVEGLAPTIKELAVAAQNVSDLIDKADSLTGPVGGIGEAFSWLTPVGQQLKEVNLGFSIYEAGANAVAGAVRGLAGDTDSYVSVHQELISQGPTIRSAMVDEKEAIHATSEASKDLSAEYATLNKYLEEQAKDLQAAAKAQNDQITAQRAAADATVAVAKAGDEYKTFLGGLKKEIADTKGNQEKLNDVNREAVDKTSSLADAQVKLAEQQAAANGTTVTATEKFDLWGHSMIDAAGKLSGPLQGAVVGYIGQVNDIPPEKLTEIAALIQQGKLDEAKALLDGASQARTAAIIADADTAKAEADLNQTARDREANIFPIIHAPQGGGLAMRQAGGPVEAGRAYVVGEKQAELFVPETDGRIIPELPDFHKPLAGVWGGGPGGTGERPALTLGHNQDAAALAAAAGLTVYLTVNAWGANGYTLGDQIVGEIERWLKRNARRPWMAA